MSKKCPPGVICIENMTLSILAICVVLLGIIWYISKNPLIDTNTTVSPGPPSLYLGETAQIPINIPTSTVEETFSQVGFITRSSGDETILPLYGRYIYRRRDKQQYYTLSDKRQSVRLPVMYEGRSCMHENGCNSLSNGDVVYVEGYNDSFKVTLYETQGLRYIPSL
tara:strand:- start:632 stop:1132 length:501 start_codon:yes stop_codon:yes gene_type:complete